MRQLIDRTAASIIGIITLLFIEGMVTFGTVFRFELYNWVGYTVQGMFMFLAIWVANKIYDAENK